MVRWGVGCLILLPLLVPGALDILASGRGDLRLLFGLTTLVVGLVRSGGS